MDDTVARIKEYAAKNRSRMFALSNWLKLNVKKFSMMDAMKCLYETAGGSFKELDNMLDHLTAKKKTYGRTQVYNTNVDSKMDILPDGSGKLVVRGYKPNEELAPKGQHQPRNSQIFRKGDDVQVKKNYQKAEANLMDVGARLRKLLPDELTFVITFKLRGIRDYAVSHKISMNDVMDGLEKGRLTFDARNRVVPTNAPKPKTVKEGRVIKITEAMEDRLREEFRMTEYKFQSNIKQFLHDLLVDPVNASVPYIFKVYGYNRSRLLGQLVRDGIVKRHDRISDKDENGEPKTATMMVKFAVPKKNFERKLKKLYIKMFERNVPQPHSHSAVNEDGEGGGEVGGATNCTSSGQYSQPLFGVQRRKMPTEMSEDTTTSTVGDYQYDVPFVGDKETLSRKNGKGGSTSVNVIDESRMDDYLEEYGAEWVFSAFDSNENPWYPLIDPSEYRKACEEFVQYGRLMRFPSNKVYQWIGILMKNTLVLGEITAICGHAQSFPMDDFLDHYFGDQYDDENVDKWDEWCSQCGDDGWEAAYEYLAQRGFEKWAVLPDGSDAISDYGLTPIWNVLNTYKDNTTPEEALVIVNRVLDVYHCRGDLASAFIVGGSKSCYDVSFRQNESVRKGNRRVDEYLDKRMIGVRDKIRTASDKDGRWTDKPYGGNNKEIVHNQWMIHFADQFKSANIAANGFTKGNGYDANPRSREYGQPKVEGGYNYAYLATDVLDALDCHTDADRNDLWSSFMWYLYNDREDSFVMFVGNGFRFLHVDDAENQVVFNNVQPGTKVYVKPMYNSWCVMTTPNPRMTRRSNPIQRGSGGRGDSSWNPKNESPDIIYFSSRIEDTIRWVMTNFGQYRKKIAR